MPTALRSLLGDPSSIKNRVANAATNIVPSDRGGCVRKTAAGAVTYTIRTDALEGWDDSASILAANDSSSGDLTINPSGVTLTAGTTTGAVTIPPGESRLLHRVDVNTWRAR